MKYRITHTTAYEYAETVPVCQNVVYLTPRQTPYQQCARHRLTVRPHPATCHRRVDYFGNTATLLSIDKGHRVLSITASSTIELAPRPCPDPAQSTTWETVREGFRSDLSAAGRDQFQFAFPSPLAPVFPALRDYARESFAAGRPILAAVAELNERIHGDFQYDATATTVSTPLSEVFQNRRGVCQDMAHLMVACLRALGLAARYVSGYLRTYPPAGQPRLVGADASHAWVSVFAGRHGWIDVDPTNNLFPDQEHVVVAWGRDYGDVCPVSGMSLASGGHILKVSVDVAPIERS